MENKLKITSQNFRRVHLGNFRVAKALEDTDILLAQEIRGQTDTKVQQQEVQWLERKLKCKIYLGSIVNSGCIAIVIKEKSENYVVGDRCEIVKGRGILLTVGTEEYLYNIVNPYGPASDHFRPQNSFCSAFFKEKLTLKKTVY